jgi:uncharacterized LabA/DUF88 family protein
MKRVGVFIDIQNVYLTTQALYGHGRINFATLRDFLLRGTDGIVTMSAFTCFDPESDGQRSFRNALGLMGYRVISKPLRRLPDGTIKANMDMDMAVEILTQAEYLDEVVLVTGDGDFKAIVDALCLKGKVVKIIGPDRLTSPELIQASHQYINLHQIEGILQPGTNHSSKPAPAEADSAKAE